MLEQLRLDYLQYMTLIGTALTAKVVALPALGAMAHRAGARRLLWIGGIGIIPLPALWIVSDSYAHLLGVQVVAGVFWAAYELGMFLMFFESIRQEERTSLLTMFSFANALAMAGGALVGATLLRALEPGPGAYFVLFAASALMRIAAIPLLARVPKPTEPPVTLTTGAVAVRPSLGTIERPVVASVMEEEDVAMPTGSADDRGGAGAP
jgi:MFS family permease